MNLQRWVSTEATFLLIVLANLYIFKFLFLYFQELKEQESKPRPTHNGKTDKLGPQDYILKESMNHQ